MAVKLDLSAVDAIVEKSGYKQEAIISVLQDVFKCCVL